MGEAGFEPATLNFRSKRLAGARTRPLCDPCILEGPNSLCDTPFNLIILALSCCESFGGQVELQYYDRIYEE